MSLIHPFIHPVIFAMHSAQFTSLNIDIYQLNSFLFIPPDEFIFVIFIHFHSLRCILFNSA